MRLDIEKFREALVWDRSLTAHLNALVPGLSVGLEMNAALQLIINEIERLRLELEKAKA